MAIIEKKREKRKGKGGGFDQLAMICPSRNVEEEKKGGGEKEGEVGGAGRDVRRFTIWR